jgi:hypothetical protein
VALSERYGEPQGDWAVVDEIDVPVAPYYENPRCAWEFGGVQEVTPRPCPTPLGVFLDPPDNAAPQPVLVQNENPIAVTCSDCSPAAGPSPTGPEDVRVVNGPGDPAVVADDAVAKRTALGFGLLVLLLSIVTVAGFARRSGRR